MPLCIPSSEMQLRMDLIADGYDPDTGIRIPVVYKTIEKDN